jgi:hypothetical protein
MDLAAALDQETEKSKELENTVLKQNDEILILRFAFAFI